MHYMQWCFKGSDVFKLFLRVLCLPDIQQSTFNTTNTPSLVRINNIWRININASAV